MATTEDKEKIIPKEFVETVLPMPAAPPPYVLKIKESRKNTCPITVWLLVTNVITIALLVALVSYVVINRAALGFGTKEKDKTVMIIALNADDATTQGTTEQDTTAADTTAADTTTAGTTADSAVVPNSDGMIVFIPVPVANPDSSPSINIDPPQIESSGEAALNNNNNNNNNNNGPLVVDAIEGSGENVPEPLIVGPPNINTDNIPLNIGPPGINPQNMGFDPNAQSMSKFFGKINDNIDVNRCDGLACGCHLGNCWTWLNHDDPTNNWYCFTQSIRNGGKFGKSGIYAGCNHNHDCKVQQTCADCLGYNDIDQSGGIRTVC